ncbi:MAG: hypothetical protein WCO73_08645 [Verrucomicrobiota bacterium]
MKKPSVRNTPSILTMAIGAFLLSANLCLAVVISPAERNEKLLGYNEAYESLTEVCLESDAEKISAAWKEAKTQRTEIVAFLDEAGVKKFDEILGVAGQAYKQKKHTELSLAAVELYKFIVLACDASILEVPASVHLMDYAGFRNKALMQKQPVDWQALTDNSKYARLEWQKVSGRVTDQALLKSVDQAIEAMIKGANDHDINLEKSATESELALVDELEKNLKGKKTDTPAATEQKVSGKTGVK